MTQILMQFESELLCLAALIIACGSYVAWPSRWNLPTHSALAFWFVAFFVPVQLLGVQESFPYADRVVFLQVMVAGSAAFVFGLLLGISWGKGKLSGVVRWVRKPNAPRMDYRLGAACLAGAALLAFALAGMGFVPLFAEDPLAAKFFRGQYAAAYQQFALPYRAGSALVSILAPFMLALAVSRSGFRWKFLALVSVVLMVATLQRGLAASGAVLAIGVLLVGHKRTGIFIAMIFGTYLAGTLSYAALSLLGVGAFSSVSPDGGSLLTNVAATAPDVADALGFINRWTAAAGPKTLGRSFYGGLLPGNYAWNPGVWTVTLGNPSVDLSTISSGGLRLPAPVWGLVSFGPLGVFGVPFVLGLIQGWLGSQMKHAFESGPYLSRLTIMVRYSVLLAVLGSFYVLSYVNVVQLMVVAFVTAAPRGVKMLSRRDGSPLAGR